jgi:hypothetical protein
VQSAENIFEPEEEKVTSGGRKFRTQVLYDLIDMWDRRMHTFYRKA